MTACPCPIDLGRYHDGELPDEGCREVDDHVRTCPGCVAEVERLRRLSEIARAAELPPIPAGAIGRLHRRVAGMRSTAALRLIRRLTGIAAGILVVAAWRLATDAAHTPSTPPAAAPWEHVAAGGTSDPYDSQFAH